MAGLTFALSPTVIVSAVLICAYPLFLLEAAAAVLFLVRILEGNERPLPGTSLDSRLPSRRQSRLISLGWC